MIEEAAIADRWPWFALFRLAGEPAGWMPSSTRTARSSQARAVKVGI
ncbi:hypothetical protein [Phyllobacterium zundukense]|uniref:Uncharacterized protein n=1 Tax=Phyllobacterium zundukense TaxID=1867719 RepID=A0ACD4CZX9_9HYPH|nr:hypothetical protein [Phyllobacterium zundukense]UXN59116.1 hypothetical protein N8E88_09615 [Phyllobacterium zundukense]